jgi:hypothetical protein
MIWEDLPTWWPRCRFCDKPVLDGHLTCGDVLCPESDARELQRRDWEYHQKKRETDTRQMNRHVAEPFRSILNQAWRAWR